MSDPEGRSFARLEAQEIVTAAELIETLEDYAQGAAIIGRVVNEIINRTTLATEDVRRLIEIADHGAQKQFARQSKSSAKEAREYTSVAAHLKRLL